MDDAFQYPVFFECPNLDGESKKRAELYFRNRRKSGGGDCGPITKQENKVYRIAFDDRADQQRVLQKSKHEVKFADVCLVLNVRERPTCSPITTPTTSKLVSLKLDSTSSQEPPILGEEYELQPETYLLQYLKECPKAWEGLEIELLSLACSAQLYPEEGRVLVSCFTQPGAADYVRNWKAEVDKLFDGYLCHCEVDPHKVVALLESRNSLQTTNDVKVYSENGMAVVVGQRSQVNAKLMDVDALLGKQRPRLLERETCICRLGEAKLRLLWKEIEHTLPKDFPGVKVTQGAPGQLHLEGSVEDILKAKDWISDQEKLVFERTVSDMSPHFLSFLRNVYGGPGVLGQFLGFSDNAEVELRETEVRFFSLSADKLNDIQQKLQEKFKEVKIDVPNCSAVPSELQEQLKSETKEMNQGQYRSKVVFGPDSSVFLLGHTKEVEKLNEVVIQFILDHASIEGKVNLPYPELALELPELLQLHGFDYSGVTFCPLRSSSRPTMLLEGPSGKVTEVKNRLCPFFDSLVKSRVTIELPGAVRYIESSSGRDNILRYAHSQKCLVQPQEQAYATRQIFASDAGAGQVNTTVASYSLRDGLQVLVCQGDISKQEADALVNAANEDLDHGGGVAAALSKAGGPQVQKESRALVKQTGKIPTGDAVVTTGGNLNCKNLVHAVGPVGGKAGGQERVLLEKTVKSALNLAEMMEFRSIAMPCISSGVFGVPVTVCSEAIVTAVKEFCSQGGRSLRRIILIDNRGEVVRSMQDACDRLLQGTSTGNRAPSDLGFQMDASAQYAARGATAGAPGGGVHVEIIQGSIENQQVDGLVSPMVGHDPLSSRVGNFLSSMVGPQLTAKFYNEAGGATIPGEIILVEDLPALQSRGVFFINLTPWDNNQQGTAVQVLRNGIKKMLASCQICGYSSVALPVLGVGAALRFPHSVAARVIMEEVRQFEHNRITGTSFLVRIIVQSIQSSKAFQSCQDTMHLRGFTNDADPDQASFYRHISATNDEVTASLGGIKLQMAVGDITKENTDVIINTTDFSNNQSGVSKAILTAAGPSVQTQLAQMGTPADFMCTTGPGGLACKEIIHASFMRDHEVIRKNCNKILKHCESKGYSSVSFPAVNTGAAHMDLTKACKALLDGMTSAITDLKPSCLKLIRIVIFQQSVFQAFRSELENRFGQTATRHLSLREKAKQMLKKWQETRTRTTATPKGQIFASSKPPPAVIIVIGCGPDIIRTMKRDLEGILQDQLIEKDVDVEDFSRLDDMEREAVQAKLKVLGVSLEYKKRQSSEGRNGNRAENAARAEARDRSGSGTEVYVLKGLKEDVLTIIELINKAIRKALSEDNQENNEAMLALDVQWSIQDTNEVWRELSLHDNYILEEAHKKKQVFVDITSPDRIKVSVNLKENKATNQLTGITFEVKRNESDTTLVLPTHWEPMHEVHFKKVELQPTSSEYKNIAQGFLQTAKYNIHKIERVQNLYLWYGYTVLKNCLLAKNDTAGDGEKLLYHGTSAESCNCIETGKFDRNFAGTHAALYGKGVYFAVTAAYSADRFSPADASGMKRLYVAQVLTGRYTIGNSDLKAPPPRGSDKTDCFDSCVDNQQNPSMFVIFHDHQAYPEYLITFS
ncbi:hypothetical protein F7725_004729 [Dissostichus mawsoni]|uniref:Poly [ADP-ribose] polymerase n=1 Tax=Dissostichus mawsoni TaxID=36200 RepID=A0A7J5XJL5_DISMA|nr:hypothetical protein F7725_004729 [Dissostichus mawsoni]